MRATAEETRKVQGRLKLGKANALAEEQLPAGGRWGSKTAATRAPGPADPTTTTQQAPAPAGGAKVVTICCKGSDRLQQLQVNDGDIILIDEYHSAYRFDGATFRATTDPTTGQSCLFNLATNDVMYMTNDPPPASSTSGGGGGGGGGAGGSGSSGAQRGRSGSSLGAKTRLAAHRSSMARNVASGIGNDKADSHFKHGMRVPSDVRGVAVGRRI